MTDNIIQQARDVLAKWRADADQIDPVHDVELIVGTAGNPELLDAIDALLSTLVWSQSFAGTALYATADRIVAAILAADERMSA